MNVTRELFVIPYGNKFILFAPLKGSILEVNETTVALLKECNVSGYFPEGDTLLSLKKYGIIYDDKELCKIISPRLNNFQPHSVTLFPTSDCNANCTYCYGNAGETHYFLSLDIAKAAIDLVFNNAINNRSKKVVIGFHGGGEPFYGKAWKIIQEIVYYAHKLSKKYNIFISLSAGTNGILSLKQLEWIVNHFGNLNISLDGPEDIQNNQRPLKSGRPSFPYVMRTIKYLEAHKFSYGIRTTITQNSVKRLPELVKFFHSISSLKRFHFEPLFECGRCKTTGLQAPNPFEFAVEMVAAMEYAKNLGLEIYYSGASIDKVVDSFCGASGKSFCVTPQGYITSCFEVSLLSDERSKIFFYGHYDHNQKKFIFDQDKLGALRKRNIFNLPHCSNCFIKYQCAGDCLAKVLSTGDMFDTNNNPRCHINQTLSLHKLTERLNQSPINMA